MFFQIRVSMRHYREGGKEGGTKVGVREEEGRRGREGLQQLSPSAGELSPLD